MRGLLFIIFVMATCSIIHAQTPLRLNHLQMKGTHNSYHVKTPPSLPVWDASQIAYSQQAATQNVRAFEIDVNWDNGDLTVYHFKTYDAGSVCQTLYTCLYDIYNSWFKPLVSQPNPPIVFIQIEAKSAFNTTQWSSVDHVIQAIIPRNQTIIPADVQGNFSTLRDAVLSGQGWPTLNTAGGRFLFFLDSDYTPYYGAPYQNLKNRMAFPGFTDTTNPLAAVLVLNDPVASHTQIVNAVSQNFLVRTRADSEIANITIPPDYNETTLRYFIRMDLDNNGLVSVDELINFIETLDPAVVISSATLNAAIPQYCSGNPTGFSVEVYRCIESKAALFAPTAYPNTVLYLFGGNVTGPYQGQTILTSNTTMHAAVTSGAHFVSTDFAGGPTGTLTGLGTASNMSYSVSLPATYICNPVTTNTCQNNDLTFTYSVNIPAPVGPPAPTTPAPNSSSSTGSSASSSSSTAVNNTAYTVSIMTYGMGILSIIVMVLI